MYRGKDRRRRGAVNRLRRTLFGLLVSVPSVAAATQPTPPATGSAVRAPAPSDGSDPAGAVIPLHVHLSFLEPELASSFGAAAAAAVATDPLYRLRHGVAFDYGGLVDGGALRLALFAKRDPRRWELNPQAQELPGGQSWSVGGAVDVVHRNVRVAPQLVVDLDRLAAAPGQMQLTIQYANWQPGADHSNSYAAVPQARIDWRF
jgi:hypothetical protein